MWTGFCIGGSRENILFNFVTDMYCEYWKLEEAPIDYLLLDYMIAIGRESVPSIKEMIDRNPFNNGQLYGIQHKLNAEFDEALLERICRDTNIHKLNWKRPLQTKTLEGKQTFYGHLLSRYKPPSLVNSAA